MTIRLAIAVFVLLMALVYLAALWSVWRRDRRQDQVSRLDEFTQAARTRARRQALQELARQASRR
jgi:cbb3-type cytochrome oxidase subunit 3